MASRSRKEASHLASGNSRRYKDREIVDTGVLELDGNDLVLDEVVDEPRPSANIAEKDGARSAPSPSDREPEMRA